MIGAIKAWFTGLSWLGKGVVGVTSVTALSVAGGGGNEPPRYAPIEQEQSQTQQIETLQESRPVVVEKEVTAVEAIAHTKKTVNDNSLMEGNSIVKTTGIDGEKVYTYKVTYSDGEEISRKLISEKITKQPVSEVTLIGTLKPQQNCDSNYTPCIPKVSYDLDCPDLGHSVRVIGYDRHRFDRDGDGYGCESY